ncbi:MAG: FtsW/RodA/SpoVE family cell cycle protein [Anaerolineaceae bacterium]|nr:FtsW/RodA/SpoVE family cell cycle protein [Anaerolineaceae bacterium]
MRREVWRHFDFLLFGTVVILCIFGIVMIRSAIAGSESLAGLVQSQTIYVIIGIAVLLGTSILDYHYWASLTRLMYIGTVMLLLVVFAVGAVSFGSARWISTGLVNIQPSELGKIVIILVLADYFNRHQDDPHDLRWLGTSFALTFGLVIWVLLQPNLSTSIVIFVIWFALVWLSGLSPKYLAMFVGGALFGAILVFPFLAQYQQQRVITFLFPDPNARYGNSYNIEQALIAIGQGGLFGQGYGHSSQVQLRFLKVRQTDFIFSAMASEFGFVGTIIIVALLIFVVLRCFRAARLANDLFGSLIAYGFGMLILFQMAVNIGVNLKVMPVTGLTLPFISYGGSSLVSLVFGIGLVESVIIRRKPLDF